MVAQSRLRLYYRRSSLCRDDNFGKVFLRRVSFKIWPGGERASRPCRPRTRPIFRGCFFFFTAPTIFRPFAIFVSSIFVFLFGAIHYLTTREDERVSARDNERYLCVSATCSHSVRGALRHSKRSVFFVLFLLRYDVAVCLGGANNVIIRPTHVRLPQLTDVGRTGGGGTHRNIVPRGRGSSEKRKWRCFFREDTGCYALRTVYTTSRRIKKHKRPTTCLGVGREIVTENKATISAVRPPPPHRAANFGKLRDERFGRWPPFARQWCVPKIVRGNRSVVAQRVISVSNGTFDTQTSPSPVRSIIQTGTVAKCVKDRDVPVYILSVFAPSSRR